MTLVKRIFNEKVLTAAIILLIILQPVIDMDYLLYDFLDQFGLPRFSTVIRFIIIPLLIIWTFFLKEKHKKRTLVFALLYAAALGIYFVLHCRQSADLYDTLYLTTNFQFSVFQELTYVLTLVLPFGVTYCIYHMHFSQKTVRFITCFLSGVISIPIFIGDLFVFGKSTYFGYTVANLFTWFNGIYDSYSPRTLASKFFFNEGNTIGILLFMVLPLMYYFFSKAESRKERIRIGVLIAIQSLSMQILATRVATYGAVIVPAVFLVLYFFNWLIHRHSQEKVSLQKQTVILALCMAAVTGCILPYTPAVKNQQVDAVNDVALLDNGMAEEGKTALADGENLVPGTAAFNNFYINMFEVYGIKARYISSVPSAYYIDYYNYKFDSKFWVDVTFMDVYDRVSGRQIENIFMNYKYQNLTAAQKILGMGYSTFMSGSILLEQDFKQQVYTLGYAGELLCCIPWILFTLLAAILIFVKHKKLLNLENMCLGFSLAAGLGTAYISGHTLDQFVTSVFLALLAALLLNNIVQAYRKPADSADTCSH